MKIILRVLAPVALTALATPALAQDWQDFLQPSAFQIATGVDYSSGKYGASSDTTVLSIPLDMRAQFDRVRLEATLPYLQVKGPGVFTGGVVIGSGTSSTRSGLGDLTLGAAYLLHADSNALPAIEFEGLVKVPTAGSGLGTGKADYTAQANIYHSITPRVMLFGTVGYQWLSNFKTFTLENGVLASAGVNFKPTENWNIGVAASYHQEYYRGLGEQFTVSPYLLWNFAANWRISAYGIVGTTKASPDYGAGMRLIFAQ